MITRYEEIRKNFDDFEAQTKQVFKITKYEKDTKRDRNRKLLPDESRSPGKVNMNGREHLRSNAFLLQICPLLGNFAESRKSAEKLIAS